VTLGEQASRLLDVRQAVVVWEVATGKCLRRYQGKPLPGLGPHGYINFEEQNAAVSPGLKYVACQRRDETGRLVIYTIELATGKLLARIDRGGFGGMHILCFAADRTLLWDHFPVDDMVFSDVTTGKELRRVGNHTVEGRSDATQAIALSPDGQSLAICRESHTIEFWDVKTGKVTRPLGKPSHAQLEQRFIDFVGANVRPALSFSPDGKRLVCSLGGSALRQFHAGTGKEIAAPGSGGRAPLSTLALSADSRSLRAHGCLEAARSWDWATGKQTGKPEVPAGAEYAVFAAGGHFAYAVGNQVTFHGPAGKKTWRIAADEYPPLTALALSPDGSMLATRSWDHTEVHLWDANGKERFTLGKAGFGAILGGSSMAETAGVVTPDVVFSPDGSRLAAAGNRRQLCLWDMARGTLLWEAAPEAGQAVERFAFSPNGQTLAAVQADHTVILYEAASGAKRGRLGKADLKRRRVYVSYDYYGRSRLASASRLAAPVCVAFSPGGRYLAMANQTPAIHLWDVLTGREVGTLRGHEGGVVGLLFTPDGKRLISAGTDTTALTWDLARLTRRESARGARLSTQTLDALWTDLAGTDGARAFAAIRKLCASPDQTVSLIRERLRPASPADPKRLAALIADLESDRYEHRQQAASELEALGDLAVPELRKALADDPPLDLRQRLQRLLRQTEKVLTGGRLRELRALEVLEQIDSPAARQVLRSLAGGAPGARLTREAKSAGERVARQTVRR
jgi:WD40 repeat protein